MKVTIYTDGSSRGNPGPGGWGAILITESEVLEFGGGEPGTTNNRMELTGAIMGLREVGSHMKVTSVEVCTDSEYVKKGMTEWIEGWIQKNWKNSQKKDVLNRDLWEGLLAEQSRLNRLGIGLTWIYVPGHAGVPLNERADVIATSYADGVLNNSHSNLELYRGERTPYPFFEI